MPVYALRKRRGHWTVSSGSHVLLDFDSYDEAVETTQTAMRVLKPSTQRDSTEPGAGVTSEVTPCTDPFDP
jgi:hypothetical protein